MIEDRFIYILLPVPFIILTIIIFALRKDLRHRILKVGLIGGIAGWFHDFWLLRDYWQPPTIFGHAMPLSIEDFITGFSIAAVSVTLYSFITKTKPASTKGLPKNRLLIQTILLWVLPFIIFVGFFKIPSPIVTFAIVMIYLAVMWAQAPRLIRQSLMIGGIFVVIGLLDYFLLFHVLAPGYIDRYFMLTDAWYNPTLLGFYPLLELVWYFTWGAFAGIFVEYLGRKQVKNHHM